MAGSISAHAYARTISLQCSSLAYIATNDRSDAFIVQLAEPMNLGTWSGLAATCRLTMS